MTTNKNITNEKEELDKDNAHQEVQDYENNLELSDEALANISGGMTFKCWKCGSPNISIKGIEMECLSCGTYGDHIRTFL